MSKNYDLIVVGAGAAGMIAAIRAARNGKKVLLLEKLSQIAAKLRATGGGRCNLTNTLSNEEFMAKFGRDGRFMQDALNRFNHKNLIEFFKEIGVETHAPDGFRVFPTSHSSATIISALQDEMQRVKIDVLCSQKVEKLLSEDNRVSGVQTSTDTFFSSNVIIATGGLGYPVLGAEGDGYSLAHELGHKTTELHPAMMPLKTKEEWVGNCRADTIAKAELRVDIKKHKKLKASGDLIFTKSGIRGPVVLDFAREITPLISKYGEVPILVNLTKGMNEEQITKHLKDEVLKNPDATMKELVSTLLPEALSLELCKLTLPDPDAKLKSIPGLSRAKLINYLAWTPLTVTGHDGFKMAMITRGGIVLKEIDPKTMQSKIIDGLYFCGEVMNLDGPCGGYNLQWSFASGHLAGSLKK
ncbi:FAD-dependent pyridine nucleotide-disulfide oxidoreductase [Sulfurimonas gotlandica GD1]|uniref:FAD-dependent pyridine nucleotide-disulfide oxidoreductase n=1 Tax=Sulfurimonas gotlandica (strain DSM 19862 / JCM 16533 / GD1) TaxID=929558 RepID=B6BNB7_SULGG|nr:NAD(P)/FAD-dependent oxidoreductase [Sulfurimonas gotlandica]EDZ61414.1 tRNA uridine 5-carboxymethylaminomethyl modification enzyme GidA [Sulfurimonas gotlandica GD1]EHP30987.1 FAD-dependent pyridine nucleotide-disulfide oxidoreductase [Sulfurimonas gotlandica GD1]